MRIIHNILRSAYLSDDGERMPRYAIVCYGVAYATPSQISDREAPSHSNTTLLSGCSKISGFALFSAHFKLQRATVRLHKRNKNIASYLYWYETEIHEWFSSTAAGCTNFRFTAFKFYIWNTEEEALVSNFTTSARIPNFSLFIICRPLTH